MRIALWWVAGLTVAVTANAQERMTPAQVKEWAERESKQMAIVAPHNLRRPDAGIQRPFGVRITLRLGDPFRKLLGADWNKTHWYGTALERDAAIIEMSRKHEYSRPGDKPALKFDKVEKLHESRGL